jgi:hypothetical protein
MRENYRHSASQLVVQTFLGRDALIHSLCQIQRRHKFNTLFRGSSFCSLNHLKRESRNSTACAAWLSCLFSSTTCEHSARANLRAASPEHFRDWLVGCGSVFCSFRIPHRRSFAGRPRIAQLFQNILRASLLSNRASVLSLDRHLFSLRSLPHSSRNMACHPDLRVISAKLREDRPWSIRNSVARSAMVTGRRGTVLSHRSRRCSFFLRT